MRKMRNNLGSGLPAFSRNDDGAGREMVLSTDQIAAPNDEITPNGMSRTPELYLRPMRTSSDMSIKPARSK